MLNNAFVPAVLLIAVSLLAACGESGTESEAAQGDTAAGSPPAEPAPEDTGRALRREIEMLDRKRSNARTERESLESELESLSSELAESESEAARLEAKIRRLETAQ